MSNQDKAPTIAEMKERVIAELERQKAERPSYEDLESLEKGKERPQDTMTRFLLTERTPVERLRYMLEKCVGSMELAEDLYGINSMHSPLIYAAKFTLMETEPFK